MPVVRGQGLVVAVNRTVLYPRPDARAKVTGVEDVHFSAGNRCKGSDLPHRRQNMMRGRNIQAGQKDLVDLAPPGDPGGPSVQESQGAQGCQADSPLKVLLVQGGLLVLEFQCLDFLSLP